MAKKSARDALDEQGMKKSWGEGDSGRMKNAGWMEKHGQTRPFRNRLDNRVSYRGTLMYWNACTFGDDGVRAPGCWASSDAAESKKAQRLPSSTSGNYSFRCSWIFFINIPPFRDRAPTVSTFNNLYATAWTLPECFVPRLYTSFIQIFMHRSRVYWENFPRPDGNGLLKIILRPSFSFSINFHRSIKMNTLRSVAISRRASRR